MSRRRARAGAAPRARQAAEPAHWRLSLFGRALARRAALLVENALPHRQVEEHVEASRVLAAIGDGIVVVDGRGVVRLWNPAAEMITGLSASVVVGRQAVETIPGWAAVASRVPIAPAGEMGAASVETVPLDLADREVWVSVSGVRFSEGVVYALRDLTHDRAPAELKTELISTVSHELRAPLAAIYGAAMTLRRKDFAPDAELQQKLLSIIAREAERLGSIVGDILWTGRLDSGGMELSIESCDARGLVESVLDAAETHRPAGIELRLRSPESLPAVAGDPEKIRQVLTNLLDNAIKYSPDGGPVEIELSAGEASLRFSVHDEGLGVPPVEHARIFEKFHRFDPGLTRGIGGTGLGLYICRELVQRMNGRIWVESPRARGMGSSFSFELPLARDRRRGGA